MSSYRAEHEDILRQILEGPPTPHGMYQRTVQAEDEGTSPPSPMTPVEQDIARTAVRDRSDGLLLDILWLARGGIGVPVGLLVNGMVILGQLTNAETMATAIDHEISTIVSGAARPEEVDETDWATRVDAFASYTSRTLEEQRQEERQLDADLEEANAHGSSPDAIDRDLARRVMDLYTSSHLTLTQVSIVPAGSASATSLPVVRVALSSIAAWWPLHVQDGMSSIALWGMSPQDDR